MDGRERTIQSNLKASEEAMAHHETNIRKIEKSLKAARVTAKETQENFMADAQQEKERILLEIAQECRAKVNEAKEHLEKQVEDLKKDLASESKVLSEKIEQRILH